MKRIVLILVLIIVLCCCKKNSFISAFDAKVSLSADTIRFDTLFTSTGSVTHYFKVFNNNDKKLRLSDISLAGGSHSYFKINVDGAEGPSVQNLEIDANDSLYVFITATIDPTSSKIPFVVQDSIGVSYNGNRRWVQLQAWGQNGNFLRNHAITSDTTWTNEKPFVILGGLLVAEGATLTIQKGCRIYMHADAPFVVDGTLNAVGEKFDSTKIIFTGDRLDEFYRDLPASWPGIYFRERSVGNTLQYVVVKNAYQGIVAEKIPLTAEPKVTLKECIIDNCYDAGILGVETSIEAINTLVSNCGKNVLLVKGGEYDFTHCTDVAISNSYISHRQPVLGLADFLKVGDDVTTGKMKATFTNCIFWGANGTVDNEVIALREGNEAFDVKFSHCLWKANEEPGNVTVVSVVVNEDPLFETMDTRQNRYNFRLKAGSPAINKGVATAVSTDLDGNNRVNIPDIGAYETTF